MKTRTVAAYAAFAALVLVGTYWLLPRDKRPCDQDYDDFCSSGTCELTVTLSACLPSAVKVKPDTLHVCNNNQPLNWTIKTVGYVFEDKTSGGKKSGIDFKGNDDFDKEMPGGATYSWRDKHGKKNPDITYGVNILKDGGGPCTGFDPRISND